MCRVKKPLPFTKAVCKKLLTKIIPSQLKYVNRRGNTILMFACENDCEDTCMAILDYPNECNLFQVNKKGDSIITLSMKNHIKKLYEKILVCILNTSEKKMTEIAEKILSTPELCALNNITDIDNDTVLIIACRHKMEEICLKILDSPNDCAIAHSNMMKTNARMLAKKHNMKKVYDIIVSKQNSNKSKARIRFENTFCGCFHMWE